MVVPAAGAVLAAVVAVLAAAVVVLAAAAGRPEGTGAVPAVVARVATAPPRSCWLGL